MRRVCTISSHFSVYFHTDPNLEDVLAQELNIKLGLFFNQTNPTNTGHISTSLGIEQLVDLLKRRPTLWTAKKVRIHLFSIKMQVPSLLEKTLSTELAAVCPLLHAMEISEINCKVVTAHRPSLPQRQILGLVKNILHSQSINLNFQRKLPYLHLNISDMNLRGTLEIGRLFAPKIHLNVHYTPLSTAATYTLINLGIGFLNPGKKILLDPMCGYGTLLYVSASEAKFSRSEFAGIGVDVDENAIIKARENLSCFSEIVTLRQAPVENLEPNSLPVQPNLILTHPPYGFSPFLAPPAVEELYEVIFRFFAKFPGTICGMVTPHIDLLSRLPPKYLIQTLIQRPFLEKTLHSYIWIGRTAGILKKESTD